MHYCSSPNIAEEEDFVPEMVSFVFPPGSVNTVCGEFQILSDNVALEGNEQFVVDLSIPFLMTVQGMEGLDLGSFITAANCNMSGDVTVSSARITIIDTDGMRRFCSGGNYNNYYQRATVIILTSLYCSVDCKLFQ